MRDVSCAPLFLLVCLLTLLLLLLYLCNRLVDSSPYLAFYPFPPEAALGRQIIKVSISFYTGQRSLLCFAEQGLFQFGLVVRVCGRLQGLGGVQMRPVALRCHRGQARWIIGFSGRKHRQYCFSTCP